MVAPSFGAHVGDHVSIHGRQAVQARAIVFHDASGAALDAVAAQHFQDHILRAHPVGKPAGELDAPHLRHAEKQRFAGHGLRHLDAARAEGQHAEGAGRRRVAVRTDKGLPRLAEAVHVHGMADAVSRPAVPHAEAAAGAAEKQVLVGIEMIVLNQIVVDVLGGEPHLDAIDTHRFQLEHHQRAEDVLQESLIDRERNLLADNGAPFDEMRRDELLRQVRRHAPSRRQRVPPKCLFGRDHADCWKS